MERINPAGCSLGRLVSSVVKLENRANSLRQAANKPDTTDLRTLASDKYTAEFRDEARAVYEDLESLYAELDRREVEYRKL
jgi:hypothetical protein